MALTNPFFSVDKAASFADARQDMAGMFASTRDQRPIPGVLGAQDTNLVCPMAAMSVSILPFTALINRQGAILMANNAPVTLPLTAPATGTRTDIIYARQQETAYGDTADGPAFGTVPANGALPAGALELARATIPAGATATNGTNVTIEQTWTQAAMRGNPVGIRTETVLQSLDAENGTTARLLSNGNRYLRRDNQWICTDPLTLFTPGQWAGDWNTLYYASLHDDTLTMYIKSARAAANWQITNAWGRSEILRMPLWLAPTQNDMNFPAVSSRTAGSCAFQTETGSSYASIAVRPAITNFTIYTNDWFQTTMTWRIRG